MEVMKVSLDELESLVMPESIELAQHLPPVGDSAGFRNVRVAMTREALAKAEVVAEESEDADVCVYGGTSGGVVAAVQAARIGKRVVLVEPGRHLGGMMAGGLSWSDVGSAERAKLSP